MADPENALAPREEETDAHFEPVIKLTEQVETKTNEEEEESTFKMRAKLFRFDTTASEWKERGTGDVKLLKHTGTGKIRLVMRRDKTLKVCANHLVSADMKLQPNIGSDRSWVWKVVADYSESPPTSETLAIRFANAENAGQFKTAFEEAQAANTAAGATEGEVPHTTAEPTPSAAAPAAGEKAEEKVEEKKAEEPAAQPAPIPASTIAAEASEKAAEAAPAAQAPEKTAEA